MVREKADGGGSTEDAKASRRSKKKPGDSSDDEKCGACTKECKSDEKALSCDSCAVWFHAECAQIPDAIYKFYGDKEMATYNFYCKCKSCSDDVGNKKSDFIKYVDKTNNTLAMLQEEMTSMKTMMKENGKVMKENGKALQDEIKKVPTFANIVKEGGKENKVVLNQFAARMANTHKRISDDREDRKNNVIIFNLKEDNDEDDDGLKAKFDGLCKVVTFNKSALKIERIGRKQKNTVVNKNDGGDKNSDKDSNKDGDKTEEKPKIRPIKVKFQSEWDKRLFFSKLYNLKDNKLYDNVRVCHDMGNDDRDECKRLLDEAADLNKENKDPSGKWRVRGPPSEMQVKWVPFSKN